MEKTISSLNYQLGKIEELIKKDLKNKTFIYNFFVNEDSEKLLDLDSLIDFLSQTTIAKTLFLSSIVKKCMRIIDYWNNDSFELEKEELYSYYNESTGVFVNSQSKFHCIVLKPFEWEFINTESELNYFFDNYNYKIYSIQQIAKRCTIIINWITANYPETTPDEVKKDLQTHNPDEVKKVLHDHIFKDNAFEIWEAMYNAFQITKRSRTDLRFMYEIMKYNKEIHDTVTVTNILNWINEVYDFGIDKLHYTNINDNSNRMRRNTYDLIKQRA